MLESSRLQCGSSGPFAISISEHIPNLVTKTAGTSDRREHNDIDPRELAFWIDPRLYPPPRPLGVRALPSNCSTTVRGDLDRRDPSSAHAIDLRSLHNLRVWCTHGYSRCRACKAVDLSNHTCSVLLDLAPLPMNKRGRKERQSFTTS